MVIAAESHYEHDPVMSKVTESRLPSEMTPESIGDRLGLIRRAYHLKPGQIADSLGIERTYWSRFEKGRRPITNDVAYLLTEKYGVTLDFIILGKWDKLTVEVAEKLRSAPAKV